MARSRNATNTSRLRQLNIVVLYNNGQSVDDLCKMYGYRRQRIVNILNRYAGTMLKVRVRRLKPKPWTQKYQKGCRSCGQRRLPHFKYGYCRQCFKKALPEQFSAMLSQRSLNTRAINQKRKAIQSPEAYRIYLAKLKLKLYEKYHKAVEEQERQQRKAYQEELLKEVGIINEKNYELNTQSRDR